VTRILEIRSYHLKPGTRERFHVLFERDALPALRSRRVDVVAYGPSPHDRESYFLMRSYAGEDDRLRSEDAFYARDEWRVLADSDTTVVVAVDEATLRGLRRRGRQPPNMREIAAQIETEIAADLTALMELNRKYIRSVQAADVQQFKEILADDFLCSLPDGSLIDRAGFLEQTAGLAAISDLEVHDVRLRIMGDVAIVHARTTFTARNGCPGVGRYTDVWARRCGRWLAVSAHITRN
jgi:ketosteroid isomerase-like protein